jgi:hypothetical protein
MDSTRIQKDSPPLVDDQVLIGLDHAGGRLWIGAKPNETVILVLVQDDPVDIFRAITSRPPLVSKP